MRHIQSILLVIAFVAAACYFGIVSYWLIHHGWEGGLLDFGDFAAGSNLFAAICAALVGLAILFVLVFIVAKAYNRNHHD